MKIEQTVKLIFKNLENAGGVSVIKDKSHIVLLNKNGGKGFEI